METEYVYHDAVLLKAVLAGSVFSLNVWLYPVYYPGGKEVRLEFEGCRDVSVFEHWLRQYAAVCAEDGDDECGLRVEDLAITGREGGLFTARFVCDYLPVLRFNFSVLREAV